MKQSGVNYQVWSLGLDTGALKVFYTFEEGAGTTINSVSGGQSLYNGTLASNAGFWVKPGSGFANGSAITVGNAAGLASPLWTMLFGYEKVNANAGVLFQSLNGSSGFNVGLTAANRPYLETFNAEPVLATSTNNYASKAVISLSYFSNSLSLGYYNPTSQQLEQETFSAPFALTPSNAWSLFPQFTGYVDFFLYFTDYYDANTLNKLLSGLYYVPTGVAYQTQTICSTGITGYQTHTLTQTGITGYNIIANAGDGYPDYAYVFPTATATGVLTGIIGTTSYSVGLTGVTCYTVTGGSTVGFSFLSGYAASFGMQKVQLYDFILSGDVVKDSYSFTPQDDTYNKTATAGYGSYYLGASYDTGYLDLFQNGLAQGGSGWTTNGAFLTLTGAQGGDQVCFDLRSGNKRVHPITGVTYSILYTGQELYLNGLNLISGVDFTAGAGTVTLVGNNTGISGYLFQYPVVLAYTTGSYSVHTGASFDRNSSNVYRNGVRQQLRNQYIEGAVFDLLSGSIYNPQQAVTIYGNDDTNWES